MDRRDFMLAAGTTFAGGMLAPQVVFAQRAGDTIVAVTEMGPNMLDTHPVGSNRAAYATSWLLYDRLITFGVRKLPSGIEAYDYFNLRPEAAESFEMAPDGMSVTFKLRKDVKFHDGAQMTARDVKWSYDRFIGAGGFPQRQMEQGSLTDPKQFVVVDDYTFRVSFLRQDRLTMPSLAIVVPAIYNSELCKKNATAADPWALEFTKANPAGSGAYRLESFKPNDTVQLVRNADWKVR
jgi:peptide/nickel transport system substrate-binding protein